MTHDDIPVTQRDPGFFVRLREFEGDFPEPAPHLEWQHQHSQDDIDDRAREAAEDRAYWAERREADWGRL